MYTIKRGKIFVIVFFLLILSLYAFGQDDEMSAEESLTNEIEKTENSIEFVLGVFNNETGARKEIIQLMNYIQKINNQKSKLEDYKEDFNDTKLSEILTDEQKEDEYGSLLLRVKALQDNIPVTIDLIELFFDNYVDYTDIPDPKKFKTDIINPENYKIAIYEAQDSISVSGEAKAVNVKYLSGNEENFRLVKKIITIVEEPVAIVELIPYTVSDFITVGERIGSGMVKYPGGTTEIIYVLHGSDLVELKETRTIAIPDLSAVREDVPSIVCGDNQCQYSLDYGIDEADPTNKYYCPEDCKKTEKPWWLIILAISIGIIGLLYIYFYKGPGNFKDVTNYFSIKLFKRRLFTSEQDLMNLSDYIKESLKKGFKKIEIKEVLLKKGWTEEQIEHIFKRFKK